MLWLALAAGSLGCQVYEADHLRDETAAISSNAHGAGAAEPEPAAAGAPDASSYACSAELCNGVDDDCDGRLDEDTLCELPAAQSVCSAGQCVIASCLDGARDCDALASNGCEVRRDDPSHCGGCGRRCTVQHGSAACVDGDHCGSLECEPGFGDCDADAANGCETSLDSVAACGRCGTRCEQGMSCTPAGCVAAAAPPGPAPALDACPADPQKLEPGRCGCGVAELDSDQDGALDCEDGCPAGAWSTGACFPYTPLNFDVTRLDFGSAPAVSLGCGVSTLDTSPATPTLQGWCGALPTLSVQTQSDGSSLVVMTVRSLTIATGSSLRLRGSRPVALAVLGDVEIDGALDASAEGSTAGAGGDAACGASTGGNGLGNTSTGGGGGGGGGFGTAGGEAGTGDGAKAGSGGAARGNELLSPLLGGCGGGSGGGCSARTAGAGAVQLVAGGHVRVRGAVRANGANGSKGCGSEGGGGGGSSGGAVLIEAISVEAAAGALEARGGNGGAAQGAGGTGSTGSSMAGGRGLPGSANGGGGGGGGFGRVRTVLH